LGTIGEKLIARASVNYAGKRQAVRRCGIFPVQDDQETLCAAAQQPFIGL